MSMHKKPLTIIEETGMLAYGLGRDIGKPSQAADIFRHGVEWGLMSPEDRIKAIQRELDHKDYRETNFHYRLTDLVKQMGEKHE